MVLLVAIVVLLLIAISMRNVALEVEGRFQKYDWYRLYARPSFIGILSLNIVTMGLLILVSFIVGMFKDVGFGARILGWGMLAATCGPLVIAILIMGCLLFIMGLKRLLMSIYGAVDSLSHNSKGEKQKQKQRDPEESGAGVIIDQESADQKAPKAEGMRPAKSLLET